MKTAPPPVCLAIAGHDPSGGAGIGADIEAIAAAGCHATSLITALTVQNSRNVYGVQPVPQGGLRAQLRCLLVDLPPAAVKIGLVPNATIAQWLAEDLATLNVPMVLDPVLVATGGGRLAEQGMAAVLMETLLPLCAVATPNHRELRELYRAAATDPLPEASLATMASALRARGCGSVLITGGDAGFAPWTEDLCFTPAPEPLVHRQRRLKGPFHGSGCTLSSSLAAYLALGHALPQALTLAQEATHAALLAAVKPVQATQAMPRRIRCCIAPIRNPPYAPGAPHQPHQGLQPAPTPGTATGDDGILEG